MMTFRLRKFSAPLIIFGIVALGHIFSNTALAEVGASQAGSAALPGCVDPQQFPDKVVTPCSAILVFQSGTSASDRAAAIRGAGAVLRHDLTRFNAASATVPNERVLRALAAGPGVLRIVPNRPVHTMAPPYCSPWPSCKNGDSGSGSGGGSQEIPSGVARIGADQAGNTGAGVGVAVVDTGLDYNHTDLDISVTDPCFDAFNGDCQDDNGHGTHVGGIIAALDNTQDVVGVAPHAKLYGVKVLDANGSGSDDDVIAGLSWVLGALSSPLNLNIKVVNMSLGREGTCGSLTGGSASADNPMLREVIQALTAAGVTVVVAAGNDNSLEVKNMVPAGCPEAIAVASTAAQDGASKCKVIPNPILADTASFFTTDGAFDDTTGVGVTISAPGEKQEDLTCGTVQTVGILSLQLGGGTTRKSGTSMAAPHVAGVVALQLEADPTLSPEEVRSAIRSNAELYGSAPLDSILGTPDGEHEGIVSVTKLRL